MSMRRTSIQKYVKIGCKGASEQVCENKALSVLLLLFSRTNNNNNTKLIKRHNIRQKWRVGGLWRTMAQNKWNHARMGRLKMREWKMGYGQKYKGGKCRSRLAVWKAEPILHRLLDFWVNKGWFLLHFQIVASFLFYSDSLLDTAFVMWCKVVVNIKCTGFKRYLNAGF